MRRATLPLILLTAVIPSYAHAVQEVTASYYEVTAPYDNPQGEERVATVAVCEGRALRVTTTLTVTCSITDPLGVAGSMTCAAPSPELVCTVAVTEAQFPMTLCSTAIGVLADQTTETDVRCRTFDYE